MIRFLKCLFGFHLWGRSNLTFRECIHCGRQEIRKPICPDDGLTGWVKNYN